MFKDALNGTVIILYLITCTRIAFENYNKNDKL